MKRTGGGGAVEGEGSTKCFATPLQLRDEC